MDKRIAVCVFFDGLDKIQESDKHETRKDNIVSIILLKKLNSLL